MTRKYEQPLADIRFYKKRMVARVPRIVITYKVIMPIVTLILIMALAQVVRHDPAQIVQLLKILVSLFK